MAYPTLSEVKTYLGVVGTDDDAYLTIQLAAVIDAVEQYCQREFDEVVGDTKTFVDVSYQTVFLLPRFPISALTSVVIDGTTQTITSAMVDLSMGRVIMPSAVSGDSVVITYTGGFDPIPGMIVQVIYDAVGEQYDAKDNSNATGSIKSERVDGVATIGYYAPTDGVSDSGVVASPLIVRFAGSLDPYMSERAIGATG